MKKEDFNDALDKMLKNKAMTSSDIKDAILKKYPNENKNTIKSMIVRSKLLRSSYPATFNKGCYAYTLKTNRNYQELFLKLSNDDTNVIKFISKLLNERSSFLSLFTFSKLLQISSNNENLKMAKIEALRFYKDTIHIKNSCIFPIIEMTHIDQSSDYYKRQVERLIAMKILLYKHNAENIIQINKTNYLGIANNAFYYPKPLYNIYFDAYSSTPSYINDLSKKSYAVYDFAINDSYSMVECKSFVNRVIKLKAFGALVIPICVYKTIKPDVLKLIKSNGIIGIKYSSFLGREYQNVLSSLNVINSGNDLEFNCSQLESLVKSLNQIDLFEQTKGYVFEYICYRFLNDFYRVKPVRNFIVPKNGNANGAQFDLIIELENETIVCECKATTAGIGFGSLEKANNYTIAHTVDKISLLDRRTKKMLYLTTSYYKKINEQNKKILLVLVPQNAPIENKCLYTFSELSSAYPNNVWLKIWDEFAGNR